MVRLPVVPSRPFIPRHKGRGTRKHKAAVEKHCDQLIQEITARRPCGECNACCQVLAIEELDKPIDVLCEHAGSGPGCCNIYDARPKSCREYLCLWKLGLGTEEERPDVLGLVISPTREGTPCYPAASIHELWPGAFDEAMEFIADAASRTVLILVRNGQVKKVLGPEPRMQVIHANGEIETLRQLNREMKGS